MSEDVIARQLLQMVALQEHHNATVAEDWRERGFDYYRAVWVECAELMDHYGWKWWKHQQPDLPQVHLEIVDIWHFGLSMLLLEDRVSATDAGVVAGQFAEGVGAARGAEQFRDDVEALAATALTERAFSVPAFIDMMNSVQLGFDELHQRYVGKNVLNNFRQHHGYRDGSYRKIWSGREDNEHLVDLLAELDNTAADFSEALYAALQGRYREAF